MSYNMLYKNLRNRSHPQDKSIHQAILRTCSRINSERVRLFAGVLFAVHCFLLYRDIAVLRAMGYWQKNIGYQHLCTMHVILLVVTFIFVVLSLIFKKQLHPTDMQESSLSHQQERWRRTYNAAFAWFILLWCAVMAGWVNQHEHGLITEYIIAIFGIASALYFPPLQSAAMFAVAQIIFMLAVAYMLPADPNYSGHYSNSLAMIIIAWVLARTSFQLTATNITNQEIINRQTLTLEQNNRELTGKNERLKQLDQEKTELMGIVAHDLKSPITAVRGLAELIGSGDVSAGEVSTISGHIVETSNRMVDLVKNLLEMNRLEAGEMQFQQQCFDIVPIAEMYLSHYGSAAAQKNITLHFNNDFHSNADNRSITEPAASIILADEQAVGQVLDNLISNAIKYSPHGKNVFMRVKASDRVGAGAVRVEIQDEGPGISQDDQKKLFGKFARLSAQPTGGEHSTGLGLSIVKKLVEAMGGRVWCESKTGEGATFVVELPKAD